MAGVTPYLTKEQLASETWRDIPGLEGAYQASNFGRIKSLERFNRGGKYTRARVLKQHLSAGYPTVSVYKNFGWSNERVHKLAALAFFGVKPAGMEINHKDGNKRNNRLENLEYVSHRENINHALHTLGHGLINRPHPVRGAAQHLAKLTDTDIRTIRLFLSEGMSQSEIAKHFNITSGNVGAIKQGRSWAHVK